MDSWSPLHPPSTEPTDVDIRKGLFTDPARGNRIVPYKLYRPLLPLPQGEAGEQSEPGEGPHPPLSQRERVQQKPIRFPLIVWSHGLGGSRDGAGFLSRYVASHGYFVLHLQHPGTDTSLWEGKPGHPWDNIRSAHIPRSATLNRYRDVPFALNEFLKGDDATHVNPDRIGMSGHSFGSLTTQIMTGQSVAKGHHAYTYADPRFRAGILYSPVPTHRDDTHATRIYSTLDRPLLHMTGTDDDSPVEKFGYDRRLAVFDHAGGPNQHLFVLEGGDHMVYNGSRGQLADNPARARHEELIKLLSLAWWDWHLKDDDAARAWFSNGGADAALMEDGFLRRR